MSAEIIVDDAPRKNSGGGTPPLGRAVAALGAAIGGAFRREPALTLTGLLGLVLGSGLSAVMLARGRFVQPEGDLYKAASFDVAVGLYVLTLVLLLPLADFGRRGLVAWRRWTVGLTLSGYAIETVQISRGLDPRFTRAGAPADQIFGLVFFLVAVGLVASFAVMAWRFFFRRRAGAGGPEGMLLSAAVRYGCAAAFAGFAAGFWLSANQGAGVGAAGNILPLHAAGFHGLQAVPLVALLSAWAGEAGTAARRRVHTAGAAWLGLCAALTWQTAAGRSLAEPSAAMAAAALCLLVWLASAAAAALAWRRAGFAVPPTQTAAAAG